MATASIFRANFGSFNPLLMSFLFEKAKMISAIISESRDQPDQSPVQVVVLVSQIEIEESSSAKAPRIQLERVGSPEPVEP